MPEPADESRAPISARIAPSPADYVVEWFSIALGGAVGACLRHAVHLGITTSLSPTTLSALLPTLLVNLVGAFLLGTLMGRLSLRDVPGFLRPFLAVGLLGSFTTYSSLVLQGGSLAREFGIAVAALHFLGSSALGLLAFALAEAHARSRA